MKTFPNSHWILKLLTLEIFNKGEKLLAVFKDKKNGHESLKHVLTKSLKLTKQVTTSL